MARVFISLFLETKLEIRLQMLGPVGHTQLTGVLLFGFCSVLKTWVALSMNAFRYTVCFDLSVTTTMLSYD